ncbi:TetR/AcrR family transcriptional regulator [Propionicicella superfundia]|uniref:TetR/AcrR family transcriptional regulator n=1 Tax=Propionicicella superfundia TaxID=348582 RepID=UPI00040DA1AC|nr:TetR/AcrR family transcriptional regulator [Propionicicella superfundia]
MPSEPVETAATDAPPGGETPPPGTRDAMRTRQRLLDVARRRFAVDGYAATTLRAITEEAGVNVALVSRYFGSKEGLFTACLEAAAEDIRAPRAALQGQAGVAGILAAALAQVPGSASGQEIGSLLPLLMQSSGDENAERVRIDLLSRFAESMAAVAGWDPSAPDDELLMRTQLVMCTGIGLALARSWTPALEPLSSASRDALVQALAQMIGAVLPEHGQRG